MSFIRVSTCWKKALIGRLFEFFKVILYLEKRWWGEEGKRGRGEEGKNNNSLVAQVVGQLQYTCCDCGCDLLTERKLQGGGGEVYLIVDMNLDVTTEIKIIK